MNGEHSQACGQADSGLAQSRARSPVFAGDRYTGLRACTRGMAELQQAWYRATPLPHQKGKTLLCGCVGSDRQKKSDLSRCAMLEHTKTPPIDPVVLSFSIPPDLVDEVMDFMRCKGIAEEKETCSIDEIFSYTAEDKPCVFLRGARYRENLTQVQLAEKTGIPARHLSEMENGKRPIGKKIAKILGEALNVDPRRFLSV